MRDQECDFGIAIPFCPRLVPGVDFRADFRCARVWLNSSMRVAWLLLFSAICLRGEYLRIEVAFQDTGCATCLESLQGRLERVRGVERVEIDAANGIARMQLAAGNKVRLAPLLARITQDGTKILDTRVVARGVISAAEPGPLFQISGISESYRLKLSADSNAAFEAGTTCRIEGAIREPEAPDEAILYAEAVTPDSEAAN
jgi:hypothetical protein